MNRLHYILVSLMLLSMITACKTSNSAAKNNSTKQQTTRKLGDIALNGKVYSAIWQQNAGEFRALCYQAYNIATHNIDTELKTNRHQRPLAIITDIDETILDNSPYAVTQAMRGNEFDNKTWMEWTSKGSAFAYPGAVKFFNYAASKNIEVFYITNRSTKEMEGTQRNLEQLGFPFADEQHIMLMNNTSDKEARRMEVLQKYDVIMYLGDNLNDFSKIFYKFSQHDRNQQTDKASEEFGSRYIVLPNSGYGNWESALPGYNYQLTPAQKDSVFLKNLRVY